MPFEEQTDPTLREIKEKNLMFGTIRLNDEAEKTDFTNISFVAKQMPSLYMKGSLKETFRLRPFHQAGFVCTNRERRSYYAVSGKLTNYSGPRAAFKANDVIAIPLGTNADEAAVALRDLRKIGVSSSFIKDHNYSGDRADNEFIYAIDGSVQGTVWASSPRATSNLYVPLDLMDWPLRTEPDDYIPKSWGDGVHWGHALLLPDYLGVFYAKLNHLLFNGLMSLGKMEQIIATDINQVSVMGTNFIRAGAQYFGEDLFENQDQQWNAISKMILNFGPN